MRSNTTTLTIRQRRILAGNFIGFGIIGIALAFWAGLGWIMLFQAIQSLIFTFPPLYLLIVRMLFGADVWNREKSLMKEEDTYRLVSWRLAISTVISVGLTILFFWKINIPIIRIIRMIFG